MSKDQRDGGWSCTAYEGAGSEAHCSIWGIGGTEHWESTMTFEA